MRARLLVALEALADGDYYLAAEVLDALLEELERESDSARLPAPLHMPTRGGVPAERSPRNE